MLKFLSTFFLIIILCCMSSCKQENNIIEATDPKQETYAEPIKTDSSDKDQRMEWQKPERVIAALGNIQNKTIADLGAGIGYFSFKLLPKCEKVIAIDIDKEVAQILEGFKNTMSAEQKNKFDVRLASPSDSKLKDKEVDIILIVNTITFIDDRVSYLKNLRSHLKDNGELFIVDFKSKRIPDFAEAPEIEDRVYVHILEDELEAAGYENTIVDDTTLDFQFIIKASL